MRRPLKDLWEKKSLLKENYFCFGAAPVGHPHGRDPGHEERNTLIRNLLASKIILSRSVCVCVGKIIEENLASLLQMRIIATSRVTSFISPINGLKSNEVATL